MLKRTILIFMTIFIYCVNVYGEDFGNVEIFNIDKEKVVKVIQSNMEIQNLAVSYIEGIEGIYGKFNPVPKSGHAIKIPLNPPVKIQTKLTDAVVDVVIIMFPKDEAPFLAIFEDVNKLVCFTFKGDTDRLWRSLEYDIHGLQ